MQIIKNTESVVKIYKPFKIAFHSITTQEESLLIFSLIISGTLFFSLVKLCGNHCGCGCNLCY